MEYAQAVAGAYLFGNLLFDPALVACVAASVGIALTPPTNKLALFKCYSLGALGALLTLAEDRAVPFASAGAVYMVTKYPAESSTYIRKVYLTCNFASAMAYAYFMQEVKPRFESATSFYKKSS